MLSEEGKKPFLLLLCIKAAGPSEGLQDHLDQCPRHRSQPLISSHFQPVAWNAYLWSSERMLPGVYIHVAHHLTMCMLQAMNRMPEVEYDLKMLGDIHTRCQRLQSSGTSEDTEAGTSLAGDMALGNDVAERCTGWSADVKVQPQHSPAACQIRAS